MAFLLNTFIIYRKHNNFNRRLGLTNIVNLLQKTIQYNQNLIQIMDK